MDGWEVYNKSLPADQTCKQPKPAIAAFAHKYGVCRSTLSRRYNGRTKAAGEAHQHLQRLTVVQEMVLVEWVLRLDSWGFPPRIERVRSHAEELLRERGDNRPLGEHWVQKFLSRHAQLKSVFAAPRDQERVNALSYENVSDWFKKVEDVQKKYGILPGDTYNMNEKGFAMGNTGKQKVLAGKDNTDVTICQSSCREWVSLIECISADGHLLPAYIIFKGKIQKKSWYEDLEREHGHAIALSDKGWTNNDLAIDWFERTFGPRSKVRQQGEWRLLILDGHASHISGNAVRYCLKEKIIPLCLPPHTTHKLQPLDVGFFQPLASRYRTALVKLMSLDSSVNIQKNDFLFPFQPHLLLDTLKKPIRPFTPPEVTFTSSDGTTHSAVIKTPSVYLEFLSIRRQLEKDIGYKLELEKLEKAFEIKCVKITSIESLNEELKDA
jgi:hypothetical protein